MNINSVNSFTGEFIQGTVWGKLSTDKKTVVIMNDGVMVKAGESYPVRYDDRFGWMATTLPESIYSETQITDIDLYSDAINS